MKRILICGLPGSGKTTLAKRLVEILGNADWYNADEIREKFNDWDFSPEGRERQMNRMQDYVRKSVAKEMQILFALQMNLEKSLCLNM